MDIDPARASIASELHDRAKTALEMPLGKAMGTLVWAEIGFCSVASGDLEKASRLFDHAINFSSATRILTRPQLLLGKAIVSIASGSPAPAVSLIHEAETFAFEHSMRHYAPYFGLTRGMLKGAEGAHADAVDELKQACMTATEMGMKPVALQASILRAQMHQAASEAAGLNDALEEAENAINGIVESISDQQIKDDFLNNVRSRLPAAAQ